MSPWSSPDSFLEGLEAQSRPPERSTISESGRRQAVKLLKVGLIKQVIAPLCYEARQFWFLPYAGL